MTRESSSERRARALGARIDALASALQAAGVGPDVSARLLATAATAAMDAVALDLALTRPRPRLAASRPVADDDTAFEPTVELAA